MIEEEIFKKSIFIDNKLLKYGFTKNNNDYYYKKDIINNFEVIITIHNNKVKGKIIDKELEEEYTYFRVENQTGEFVNTIREEFINILKDIKQKCCIDNNFIYDQANRISNWVKEKYNVEPEYLWDDDKTAVFRNNDNKKWFGIIMYINKNKIDTEDKKIEVMNIKLPQDKIDELVKKDGYYRAYHMNKKYWITFILDGTIEDNELKELIDVSYNYTIETRDWVVPANPKYWDIINCFNNTNRINWKQIDKIQINDYIYIYVGQPYSCLMYKCKVIRKNIESIYKEFDKCMEIELVKRYRDDEYTFEVLKKYDLKAIRGPRRMPKKLLDILNNEKENKL